MVRFYWNQYDWRARRDLYKNSFESKDQILDLCLLLEAASHMLLRIYSAECLLTSYALESMFSSSFIRRSQANLYCVNVLGLHRNTTIAAAEAKIMALMNGS
jgi:hypothetical protein